MNLYLRLLAYLLKSLFLPRLALLDTSVLRFRVWPNDLDFNMHMNNGRYLTVMDLGRFDVMKRTGMLGFILRSGYAPVLASVKMRYRLQLGPFQPYDLQTRLVCWDDKWAFMEQRFIIASGPKAGAVAAIALIKAGIFDPRTRAVISPLTVQAGAGLPPVQSPSMPAYMADWQAAEDSLRAVTQAE